MNRIALALSASLLAVGASVTADEPTSVVATTYYRTFSHAHPVLKRIKPGEAVATKTLDSAGLDEKDVKRSEPFNPLTGPFFVEGAEPGDALVVHLEEGAAESRLGLVRLPARPLLADARGRSSTSTRTTSTPTSSSRDARRSCPGTSTARRTPSGSGRRRVRSITLEFPARPMLGCIGVAPAGDFAPTSGPSGSYGGNLDYNKIGEGATVYLPVYHPGGLLFVGDGHALQADGEPTGHRDRDVDGRGVRRRAEEGGEADRAAGRDGRRDHQHRLAARVRQRPRQRPQDGHERHGRLARQGLRDGALGRAPADRLPGALRRRHRRRVDGPLPARRTGCRRRPTPRPPSPRRRRRRPTPSARSRRRRKGSARSTGSSRSTGTSRRASSGWRSRGSTRNSCIRSRWRAGWGRTRSGSTAGSSATRGW